MLPDFIRFKNGVFIGETGFCRTVLGIVGIIFWLQAKSKTTEAKIQLSSVYTTMESMLLEYDTYATCLSSGGFNPSPDVKNRFYAVGFNAATGTTATDPDGKAATNGLASCTVSNNECTSSTTECTGTLRFYASGKTANGTQFITSGAAASGNANLGMTATVSATSKFTAGAAGYIDSSSTQKDQWSINFEKKMSHVNVGY